MMTQNKNLLFTGRGTTALWLILNSIDNDVKKILLPVNICEIIVSVIRKLKIDPIFYDVDKISGNSTLNNITEKWTDETVLLVAHNFGQPVEIDNIVKWAEARNIFIIEDVCNAYGAKYKSVSVGTFGHSAIYSFGYAKIIDTGIGGALTIKEDRLFKKASELNTTLPLFSQETHDALNAFQPKLYKLRGAKRISSEGYCNLYDNNINKFLYKIDKSQINAIMNEISKSETNFNLRELKSALYRKSINHKCVQHRPQVMGEVTWRYTCLCSDTEFRNGLINELRHLNILVSSWYPRVDKLFGYSQGDFPGAEYFESRVINFFVDKRISIDEVKRAIDIINRYQKR